MSHHLQKCVKCTILQDFWRVFLIEAATLLMRLQHFWAAAATSHATVCFSLLSWKGAYLSPFQPEQASTSIPVWTRREWGLSRPTFLHTDTWYPVTIWQLASHPSRANGSFDHTWIWVRSDRCWKPLRLKMLPFLFVLSSCPTTNIAAWY